MAGADALVAGDTADDAITATTVAEAEKIHAVSFGSKAWSEIAASLQGQIAAVRAARAVPRPRELQPAVTFDPRLPGIHYPRQEDVLRLHPRRAPPLPASDVHIAFAPVATKRSGFPAGR
jgi:hypothetical protein